MILLYYKISTNIRGFIMTHEQKNTEKQQEMTEAEKEDAREKSDLKKYMKEREKEVLARWMEKNRSNGIEL
jgi:electron transfer flavoprotein alpha subunit